ncbi:MAG: CotH kinase family protein [Calditrichaeota bacterium]|nr:CotH kinase family protein [Calditrichota bacterium]
MQYNNSLPGVRWILAVALLVLVGTASSQTVAINEFMASNENTIADPGGEYDDWIELYNVTDVSQGLSGFYLSDDLANLQKWALPDTVLPPNAFLLIWADEDLDQQGIHADFKLSAGGEALVLSLANGTIVDSLSFGEQTTDISRGRFPDGLGGFQFMLATPGAMNTDELPGETPMIAINEFLASNDTGAVDQNGEHEDWIELYNYGATEISLGGLYLSDTEADLHQWAFPDTVLGANEFLIVWADDDGDQEGLHANFKLSASGEMIVLSDADSNIVDDVAFGIQDSDVSYGRYPDGTGDFRYMYTTFSAPNVNDGPGGEEEELLFGDSLIHEVNLDFFTEAWQESLEYNFEVLDKQYMPATLTFDGLVLDSIGVRYKGNSSYELSGNTPKKSLQFKFGEYVDDQKLYRYKKINVHNGVSDPSFVREALAYKLARDLVPAPRTAYADVTVNGEPLGFYIIVEEVDKVFLAEHFTSNSGNLYKAADDGGTLEYRGSDQANYYAEYELKENEDINDWTRFVAMIDTLNNVPADRIVSSLSPILNIDGCLRELAFNMVISNFDSYTGSSRNFYFYEDPASGQIQMLPWDLNESFGVYTNGWNVWEQSLTAVDNVDHRPLTRVLLSNDSLRAVYLGYVDMLVHGAAAATVIAQRATILHELISDYVIADPNKVYSDQAFLNNLNSDVFVDVGRRIPGITSFVSARDLNIEFQLTNDFVYPGDTDNNGEVNALDILPVGVYFGETGQARQMQTFAWAPAPTLLWSTVAASYADANGDGTVNERDIVAIGINWLYTHSASAQSFEISPDDAALFWEHRAAFEMLYSSVSGNSEAAAELRALLESVLDIEPTIPTSFGVSQNYPNPFNGSTRIAFTLPETEAVTVTITDILGRVVATPFVEKSFTAGAHELMIGLDDAASGVYFFKLVAGSHSATHKMMLLR